ncbi:MAG: hypothetical protein ACTHL3_05780 [Candidatus Nitrosocosmicus sp.]
MASSIAGALDNFHTLSTGASKTPALFNKNKYNSHVYLDHIVAAI